MANMAMSAPHATPCAENSCRDRMAAATLATAVPWENRWPVSFCAPSRRYSVIVLPSKSGWSWSMPLSMKPMVTPAPGATSSPMIWLRWP